MNMKEFIKKHRQDWMLLDEHTQTITKKNTKLSPEQINEFELLYQKATHNLSYSQTFFPQEDVTRHLNDIVTNAHNLLYRDQVTSTNQIKQFFSKTFIQILIEQQKFVLIALLLFVIGAFGGFISIMNEPLNLYSILPKEIAYSIDPENLGSQDGEIDSPTMSASIMTNNIQVAFLAFAGGITFGILTTYLLIYNGIILGSIAAVFWQYGKFYDFWAYIIPHGIIELTAIFIAGGSGLLMGYRLFVPGTYSRGIQLKRQSLRSVQLLLGTIPLFIIAGIIEGYITPAPISLQAKYIFAFITLIALFLYIFIGKRLGKEQTMSTAYLDS